MKAALDAARVIAREKASQLEADNDAVAAAMAAAAAATAASPLSEQSPSPQEEPPAAALSDRIGAWQTAKFQAVVESALPDGDDAVATRGAASEGAVSGEVNGALSIEELETRSSKDGSGEENLGSEKPRTWWPGDD